MKLRFLTHVVTSDGFSAKRGDVRDFLPEVDARRLIAAGHAEEVRTMPPLRAENASAGGSKK